MALVHDDDLAQFSPLGDDTVSVYHTVHRLYINMLCQQSLEALEPDTFSYHLKCIKPMIHDVLLGQGEFLVSVDDCSMSHSGGFGTKDLSSRSSSANADASFRIATLSNIFERRSVLSNAVKEATTWGLTGKFETEKSSAATTKSDPPTKDPSCPVEGMYRLLDLITEPGSNGLGNSFFVANSTTLTAPQQLIKL